MGIVCFDSDFQHSFITYIHNIIISQVGKFREELEEYSGKNMFKTDEIV